MSIIIMIIVGFIVGLIARAIMPGDQNMGIIMTTILGIVGAVVAGFLGQNLGWYAPGEPAGWIGSVVGAIIVLFVVGLIARSAADAPGARHAKRADRKIGPLLPLSARREAQPGCPPGAAAASGAGCAAVTVRSVQPPPSTLYKVTRLDRRDRRVSTSACCAV